MVFEHFDNLIGCDRLKAFHLNDSKKGLGSHVDRHENIGEGTLGLEPFRYLVNDPRFASVPMTLETETEQHARNVATLFSLRSA
jgi:deoxyribonuclease-4